MKILVIALVTLVALCQGKYVDQQLDISPLTGYLVKYGIPEAERIRKAEEEYLNSPSRIAGGEPSQLGDHPWQAGLLIDLVGQTGRAVCGGSLISTERVLTAAHCWNDGTNSAWRFTIVLGSTTLFSGGTRLETSVVVLHPNWNPSLIRNDVAIAYLPSAAPLSAHISPIALPSGAELSENFAGEAVTASGYGLTGDGASITTNQFLSHVELNVITNTICSFAFPLVVQSSNICTSGSGGQSTCAGDSGGPLVAYRERPILIGATSFGSAFGCEVGLPGVFARVTSFMDFINQHLN